MSTKRYIPFILAIIIIMSGCGPSEEELNATATQVAAVTSAAETAAAPTFTPTPTLTPTPEPTATPTVRPTPTRVPIESLLEAAFEHVNSAESYAFELNILVNTEQQSGGFSFEIPINFEGDFLSPESMEGIVRINLFNTNVDQKLIVVGDTGYVSPIDIESWERLAGPALALLPPDLTAYEVDDIFGLELVGEQFLDGEFLYHLRGNLPSQTLNVTTGDVDGVVEVEYWLGREDGLLRQSTAVMEITNIETFGLPIEGAESLRAELSVHIAYSDFGKSVSIAVPEVNTVLAGCLAYVSNLNGNEDLFIINTDGSNPINLTNTLTQESYPKWSPDGTKLAFTSDRSGLPEIYIMDLLSGEVIQVTNNNTGEDVVAWSPDGTRLIFGSYNWELDIWQGINTISIDGTNESVLDSGEGDFWADWSPDGSQIAYTNVLNEFHQIHTMNADGTNKTQLTQLPGQNWNPVWSPDGEKIAYVSAINDSDIYLMNADGTGKQRLTDLDSSEIHPTWSPDGKYIAFSSNLSGDWNIFIMRADGTDITQVTNNLVDDYLPHWLPIEVSSCEG